MFNSNARSVGLFEHPLNDYKGFADSRVLHDFYELDPHQVGFYGGGALDARFDFTPFFFAIGGLPPDTPRWGGGFKALDNEVVPFVTEKGESTFTLTEEGMKIGDLKLEWQRGRYDNAKLHELLGHWIYQDQTLTDLAEPALWDGLGVLLVSLVVAIPKGAARRRIRKHGRRLKGPELVTARAFNGRNRSDGIGFLQQQTFTQKYSTGKLGCACRARLNRATFLLWVIRAKARAH